MTNGHTKLDTLTKWVVSTVALGLLAILGFYAQRDFRATDNAKDRQDKQIEAVTNLVNNHEVQIQLMRQRQDRVLEDLKKIQDNQDASSAQLQKILLEIRRQGR